MEAVDSGGLRLLNRLAAAARHPLVWLTLMLAIFFYKEVFLGLQFSPSDQLFVVQPWQAVKPPSFMAPSNDLRSDETLIGYPHRVDISTDIKRYGLPLWQEHTLAGSANTFSLHSLGAFAYPPFLAFLVVAPKIADTILHVSIPLYAGLSMYLLLGRLVQRRPARLLGALAFALNGYSIVWLSAFPLPAIVATLPLAIYLGWRFLEERAWHFGALFAVSVAAVVIFAYPPGSIIFLTLVAVFALCWWAQGVRARTLPLLALGGLGLLALGLAMVAVLPTVQELSNYTAKHYRPPIVAGTPIQFLASWIFPNIAGNPIAHDWRAAGNYCEFVGYAGLLPLILALGGGGLLLYRRLRANPLAVSAVFVGVLSLLLTYANPVIRVVDAYPPFNNIGPARWEFGIEFAIAVLAAFALDELLSREHGRAVVVALALGAAGVVSGATVLIWLKRHEFLHQDNFITQDYRLRLALLAMGVLALAWVVRGPRRPLGAVALVVIVFVDLFSFGVNFNPAIPGDQMYPQTPALRYLEANSAGYRVLPTISIYGADAFNVYGLDVATGYDHFRDDAYVSLVGANMSADERQLWSRSGFFTLGGNLHLDDPVFNLLSVKYAYFRTTDAAAPALLATHWRQVYSGPDGLIYENPNVLPRQFIAAGAGEDLTPVFHQPVRPDQDLVTVSGPGRLVWSRQYSSDWKITVNGRPIEAERYKGYFLSVPLTAATSTVSLSYRPSAYYTGAAVSAVSLVILVGLFVFGLVRRRGRIDLS